MAKTNKPIVKVGSTLLGDVLKVHHGVLDRAFVRLKFKLSEDGLRLYTLTQAIALVKHVGQSRWGTSLTATKIKAVESFYKQREAEQTKK